MATTTHLPEHPSVEIQDLKIEIVTPAHDMIDALAEEIMEYRKL